MTLLPARNRTTAAAVATTALVTLAAVPATWAQSPAPAGSAPPPPGPAAKSSPAAAKAAPQRTVNLVPERPGNYSYWLVGAGAGSSVASLTPGTTKAEITLPEGATALQVLNEADGTVAELPVSKAKSGQTLKLSPATFTRLRTVQVKVTGQGGQPVERAAVTLTDAGGKPQQRTLTAADGGTARFENVLIGNATVAASYGSDANQKATQQTVLAPGKGGDPVEVTLALPGSVPTLSPQQVGATGGATGAAPGTPTVVVNAGQPEQQAPRNDRVAGILGLALLIGGGFYAARWLKQRGMTVKDVLKQIGVDPSQEVAPAGVSGLKPAPAPLPPLPSLTDLPAAGPAAPAAVSAAPSFPIPPGSGPRLIGMAGPVAGSVYSLADGVGVTVGRDEANTVPLPMDKTASRRHARVGAAPGGAFEVVDEGSSNGTYVNGQRTPRQTLQSGDEIQIGSARFRFEG